MLNRFFGVLIVAVGVFGMMTTPSIFPREKINDPVKKAQVAKDVAFWEKEYLDVLITHHDVKTKGGDFADIDPGVYDEFEQLVEHDFQNTQDQLERARSEYQRYQ